MILYIISLVVIYSVKELIDIFQELADKSLPVVSAIKWRKDETLKIIFFSHFRTKLKIKKV